MAYDEDLAARVRTLMKRRKGFGEKKMFGGVCFLINGNMACGIVKSELMARIGKEEYDRALIKKHVREMDFTGKPMVGYVYVAQPGIKKDEDLKKWVDLSCKFVRTLPAK